MAQIDMGFVLAARVWKHQSLFELVDRSQQAPLMLQLRESTSSELVDIYVDGKFRCTAEIPCNGHVMPVTCVPGWLPEFERLRDETVDPSFILFREGQEEREISVAPHGARDMILRATVRYARVSEPWTDYREPKRMD